VQTLINLGILVAVVVFIVLPLFFPVPIDLLSAFLERAPGQDNRRPTPTSAS
jgi:hypothetical protein